MWFSGVLLLLAFTSVMADVEEDMKECTKIMNFEDLESIMELPGEDELKALCPPMLSFFECVEEVVVENTGFTILELKDFIDDTEIKGFLTIYVNVKNLFIDLCDEDSQLNKDYIKHSACYKSMSTPDIDELCQKRAHAAYETYKEFEDNVQEEAGEDESDDNRGCMTQAYAVACTGAQIHEACGQGAFDTYMQMMRRTTVFRYGICTEDQLNILKTKFLDNLEMESAEKELYRLALDLKKRRK